MISKYHILNFVGKLQLFYYKGKSILLSTMDPVVMWKKELRISDGHYVLPTSLGRCVVWKRKKRNASSTINEFIIFFLKYHGQKREYNSRIVVRFFQNQIFFSILILINCAIVNPSCVIIYTYIYLLSKYHKIFFVLNIYFCWK